MVVRVVDISGVADHYCLNFLFITMGCRPLSSVTSFTQLFHLSLNLLNCVELGILKKVIKLYMSVVFSLNRFVAYM